MQHRANTAQLLVPQGWVRVPLEVVRSGGAYSPVSLGFSVPAVVTKECELFFFSLKFGLSFSICVGAYSLSAVVCFGDRSSAVSDSGACLVVTLRSGQ